MHADIPIWVLKPYLKLRVILIHNQTYSSPSQPWLSFPYVGPTSRFFFFPKKEEEKKNVEHRYSDAHLNCCVCPIFSLYNPLCF